MFLDIDWIQIFERLCSFSASDKATRYTFERALQVLRLMLWMTNGCWKSFEFLDMRDFRFFVWSPKKCFDWKHDVDTIRFRIKSSTFLCIHFFNFIRKAWHSGGLKISAGTLILESQTTRSKLFTQKVCWRSISLNGFKSELRWLAGFQDMDENAKTARGDNPVKEKLYSE